MGGKDLRPPRCDARRCKIRRDVDLPGDLAEQFRSRQMMLGTVIDYPRFEPHRNGSGFTLEDGEPIPAQLEIEDVRRLLHRLHYIVRRFVQPDGFAHFIVVYGYAVSDAIKAVKFFDPANGASAGLRLDRGHGALPLREVKARYGRLTNCLLVMPSLPAV